MNGASFIPTLHSVHLFSHYLTFGSGYNFLSADGEQRQNGYHNRSRASGQRNRAQQRQNIAEFEWTEGDDRGSYEEKMGEWLSERLPDKSKIWD